MTRLFPFLAASVLVFTGCATVVRSTGAAPYPQDGTYMLYARDGRLMQTTVWRAGRLLSASERDDEGRWTRVATDGNGRLGILTRMVTSVVSQITFVASIGEERTDDAA